MAQNTDIRKKIIEAYIDHLLTKGKKPVSVYAFCKDLKIGEEEFYNHFSSFDHMDSHIWTGFFEETIKRLHSEEVYKEYSSREKLLAFYFTFIEVVKPHRSYVVAVLKDHKITGPLSAFYKPFKQKFDDYVKDIIQQGVNEGEVEERQMLTDKYYKGFWLQFHFVVNYWAEDNSQGFANTDAAIEKAVHLSFDLLAKNPLDTLFDFGKFIFQSKRG